MATAGALALGLAAIGPVSAHVAQVRNTTAASGSAYTALTPLRLLDTRATAQTMGPNSTLNLPVVTSADGVPSTATAVALNVTVTNTTDSGYLSAYPTGGTQPFVSNLNWTMGETVANSVIVPVGSGGSVTFYNHTGNTDVVVDLEGYFAPEAGSSATGAYVPLTPSRIDTGTTLGAGATTNVQVTGVGGVPAGATGAILNVTVTDTTAASYATVYPEGATRPTASNLNWPAGGTVANRVLASLSSTGAVTIYNYTGSADVIVDVSGYFTSSSATVATLPANASLYTAITPIRLVDTRVSGGTLGAGTVDTEQIAGMGGISASATAGVLNVTAVNTTAASFFTVFPGGVMPVASDVNWSAGQIVPNLTVATLSSTGSISVYNHAGSADLVIDAFGYFSPFVAPVIGISANPTSIAVGKTSTITATVTSSNLTYPDPVQFTTNGAAACGSLLPTTASVSASGGTATSTYTAGSTTGTCVITATEASGGNSASTTITQTAAVNNVAVSGTATITAGTLDTLTATVTPPSGSTIAESDKVTFTSSGTCGTLTPASVTTGTSSGAQTVQTSYDGASTAGFCTVTATEANTGQSGTFTIDQTTLASNVVGVALTPATYPTNGTNVVANGTNSYTITVTTTTSSGSLVYPNDQVELSMVSSSPGSGYCGTLSSSLVTTNGSGTATVTYTTPSEAVSTGYNYCKITGQEAASGDTSNASQVNQIGPSAAPNTITASKTSIDIPANTVDFGTTTLTVLSPAGKAVSNDPITWTSTGICGTWFANPGTANGGFTSTTGTNQITFQSAPFTGICIVTFMEGDTGSTVTVTVDYTNANNTAVPMTMLAASNPGAITAASESGAENASGYTAHFTNAACVSFAGFASGSTGTASYASNISDFATVTNGVYTLLPHMICTSTSFTNAQGGGAVSDQIALFHNSNGDLNYYVDLTTEGTSEPSTAYQNGVQAGYVGFAITASGGTGSPADGVSITYNGANDGNTTATDYLYIPVATDSSLSGSGSNVWTSFPATTLNAEIDISGSATTTPLPEPYEFQVNG